MDRGAPELFLNQSFAPRRDSLVVGTKIISSRQKRRIGASFVGIPSRWFLLRSCTCSRHRVLFFFFLFFFSNRRRRFSFMTTMLRGGGKKNAAPRFCIPARTSPLSSEKYLNSRESHFLRRQCERRINATLVAYIADFDFWWQRSFNQILSLQRPTNKLEM